MKHSGKNLHRFISTLLFAMSTLLLVLPSGCGKNEPHVSSLEKGQGVELLHEEKHQGNEGNRVTDSAGNLIKLNGKIDRIAVLHYGAAEVLRILNMADKIVCVGRTVKQRGAFFPKLSRLPSMGRASTNSKVLENILRLKPDLVILGVGNRDSQMGKKLLALQPDLSIVQMTFYKPELHIQEITTLAKILGREREARRYVKFFNSVFAEIEATVNLNGKRKPRVYFENTKAFRSSARGSGCDTKIYMAGGINVFTDEPVPVPMVTSESVVKQNPDIIIKTSGWNLTNFGGYDWDDYGKIKEVRNEIMTRPAWQNINAVRNKNVWVFYNDILGGVGFVVGVTYLAKIFYPKSTEKLNPLKIHRRYLKEFQKLDYDLDSHGVFLYPKLEKR